MPKCPFERVEEVVAAKEEASSEKVVNDLRR